MGEVDDAELVAPTTYPRASRVAYPFKRAHPDHASSAEAASCVGTLKVVYDRHFDRFFLREVDSLSGESAIPPKSPKPQRHGSRSATAKKRSLVAGVQWEDLIVPPRSVIKRNEGDISYNYQGLDEEGSSTEVVEATESTANKASKNAQSTHIGQGELPGAPQDPPVVEDVATDPSPIIDKPIQSETPLQSIPGLANDPTAEARASGREVVKNEPSPVETPTTSSVETPVTRVIDGSEAKPPQQVPASSVLAQPSPEAQLDTGSVTSNEGCSTKYQLDAATQLIERNHEAVNEHKRPNKFTSTVRVLRFLRGHIRRRRAKTSSSLSVDGGIAPKQEVAPVETTTIAETHTHVDNIVHAECGPAFEACTEEAVPVTASNDTQAVAPTQCSKAGEETARARDVDSTPVESSSLVSPLRLDLSKLTVESPPNVRAKSPQRRSPKRKARVAGHARHLEATPNDQVDPIPSSFLHVDNQHAHEIRWQGEVIHVNFDIPTSRDGELATGHREYRAARYERSEPLSHVYSLRELARIRPHADGFRRVNEACTFTPLTSSSESSESEDDSDIAVVHVPSSSDDDFDDAATFRRGDHVLFHARHRWFKGVILKRIKQSWFYDIRAANGTVFEAIQAKRIRHFEGDDEPEYSFEVGDRVLWRPSDTKHSRERRQNYKARVLAIRRDKSSSQSSRVKPTKRYDVELLTGRVVKKVPHDELSPLSRHR